MQEGISISPDRAIDQLTRYMGQVQQTIGKDHDVKSVIVAKEVSMNLRYAVCRSSGRQPF
jgi:hypothetical protein